MPFSFLSFFCFFNDTATTEIYTLSLHDAFPIFPMISIEISFSMAIYTQGNQVKLRAIRSEEHTSELQSLAYLVCPLLLEKKRKEQTTNGHPSDKERCPSCVPEKGAV